MKKSDSEAEPRSPISFHPMSNGEFEPRPVDDRDRLAAKLYRELVDEKAQRLGMTRRQFSESASGMLGALYVMNQAYGCSTAAPRPARRLHARRRLRRAGDVSATDAAQAAMDARYDVHAGGARQPRRGRRGGGGRGVHLRRADAQPRCPRRPGPRPPAPMNTPNMCPTAYLSGHLRRQRHRRRRACRATRPRARTTGRRSRRAPRSRKSSTASTARRACVIHANVRPDEGQVELDAMTQDAGGFPVAAWKTYPPATAGRGLDSAGYGQPFIERARQIGIRIVATHRGIGTDNGTWTGINSPRDVGPAAAAPPGLQVPRLSLGLAVGRGRGPPVQHGRCRAAAASIG